MLQLWQLSLNTAGRRDPIPSLGKSRKIFHLPQRVKIKIVLVFYYLFYCINTNTLLVISDVGRHCSTIWCTILFPKSVQWRCTWNSFGEGGGRESYMNHSSQAGNKVHFLSRQTISQLMQDMPGPPDINLHGGIRLLPRGGEGREGSALI